MEVLPVLKCTITIERPFMPQGDSDRDIRDWQHDCVRWTVPSPEPYQAGDCFTQVFAERHGVRDRLAQYGRAVIL